MDRIVDKINEKYNIEPDVLERMVKLVPCVFFVRLLDRHQNHTFTYVNSLNLEDVLSIVAYSQYFPDRGDLPYAIFLHLTDEITLTSVIAKMSEINPDFDKSSFVFHLPRWALNKFKALHILRYLEENPEAKCHQYEFVVIQLSYDVDSELLDRMFETLLPRMSSDDFAVSMLQANPSRLALDRLSLISNLDYGSIIKRRLSPQVVVWAAHEGKVDWKSIFDGCCFAWPGLCEVIDSQV